MPLSLGYPAQTGFRRVAWSFDGENSKAPFLVLMTESECNKFNSPPSDKFIGMELWNKSNGFERYYYNNGCFSGDANRGIFDEALQREWKIGAAGSGDDHNGTWGTAQPYRLGVWSNALTKHSILAALNAKSFFSTLDKDLRLSFEIVGTPMGGAVTPGTKNAKTR